MTTQDDQARVQEMDAAVAEKVMGWQVRRFRGDDGTPGVRFYTPSGVYWGYELPKFSTDINAAWEIVSRATEFELWFNPNQDHWGCYLSLPAGHAEIMDAASAPLAICKAALAAVSTT